MMMAEIPGFDIAKLEELKEEAELHPKMGLACWGMYLCSTGRFLQEANATNWDASRWKSLCSKIQGPTEGVAASMQISVAFNNLIDSFLAGCTVVRPSIFKALKDLNDDSSVGSVAGV